MERDQAIKFVHELLRVMVSKKASDLFITAGFPPAFKVDGKMTPVSNQSLTPTHTMETGARDHERQAGAGVRGHQGMQLRHQPARHRPLPRQCLRAAGASRRGAAYHHHHHSPHRGSRPARCAQGRGDDQARPGDRGRRHRLGQVDHARGDDRLPQREQPRPHHHHRGPDRVRARSQELPDHAARGRRRHRVVGCGAEEHAAAGTRRDSDRRNPRSRKPWTTPSPSPRPVTCAWARCTPTAPTRRWTGSSTSSPRSAVHSC